MSEMSLTLNLDTAEVHFLSEELLSIRLSPLDAPRIEVRPAGEIDLHTAPLLGCTLDHCLNRRPRALVINLVDVRYCGCRGLRVLEDAQRAAHLQATQFHVIAPSGHFTTRLVSRVSSEVRIHPHPDRAGQVSVLAARRDQDHHRPPGGVSPAGADT